MRPISVVLLAFFISVATTIGTLYGVARLHPRTEIQKRAVPHVIGLTEQDTRTNLSAVGFKMLVAAREDSANVEPGKALRQSPAAGQMLAEGEAVSVTFAAPAPKVPNVVGKNQQDATRVLEQAGYSVELGEAQPSADHAEGIVVVQLPEPGSALAKNSKVTIKPAKATQLEVPQLVGLSLDKAKAAAEQAHLKITVHWVDLPETTSGIVLRQTPLPGVSSQPVSEMIVTVNR